MRKPFEKRAALGTFSLMFAALFCMSGSAIAEMEAEPNDASASAQVLPLSASSIAVDSELGGADLNVTMDNDWFAFDASAGDVPVIKVVTRDGFDANITLYDETGELLVANETAPTPNPESAFAEDPRIDATELRITGRHYVLVSTYPRIGGANMTVAAADQPGLGGAYQLIISGVTAPGASAPDDSTTSAGGDDTNVISEDNTGTGSDGAGAEVRGTSEEEAIAVLMDVMYWNNQDKDVAKRWKHHAKRWGKRGRGKYPMPVMILSSDDGFVPSEIDQSTLRFGATGWEDSLFRCSKRARDFNGDQIPDMLCFFDVFKTDFQDGDVSAYLNGKTKDGQVFTANSTLREFRLPSKKTKSWHERHNFKRSSHHHRGHKYRRH